MACCECLLIDLVCFRKRSLFEDSVQDVQLYPHLLKAHEVELYYVLGQTCIDELCVAKQSDTLTGVQSQLLDIIENFLVEIVTIRYKQMGNSKIHAGGTFIHNNNNNSALNLANNNVYNAQIDAHIRDAKFYQHRINDFLNENKDSFSCYPFSSCICKTSCINTI